MEEVFSHYNYGLRLVKFISESNKIEGIHRAPTDKEFEASDDFLRAELTLEGLNKLQAVFAPGAPLRKEPGMNVRVGTHTPPSGGPDLERALWALLQDAKTELDPWQSHCVFEYIHPYGDGNGRTGRLLWAWQMLRAGGDPFKLPFLQQFYYQTLEKMDAVLKTSCDPFE